MENILKLQSREGGPFDAQQNRVTLNLPANKVWNLAQSYVQVMGRITAVSPDNSVYSVQLLYTQPDGTPTNLAPSPACMIKNSRLTSAKFGVMEDIRRPDLFFCNINVLENSLDDLQGHYYDAPIQPFVRTNTKGSVFRELHREGTILSTDLVAPFKIPLSQFLALGSQTLDTTALGRLDLNLELQLDRFRAAQLLKSTDNFGCADNTKFEDITGIGVYTTLTTKKSFNRLEDSPYFVGQSIAIEVGSKGDTSPAPEAFSLISGIEWIRTGVDVGKIRLSFDVPIVTFGNAGDNWTDIVITGRDATSLEFTADYVEIVLQESAEKVDMSKGLTYSTLTMEEDNGNGLTAFRQTYFLEPNCYNLWCILPNAFNDLQSDLDNVTDWRLRVDGVDLTDRNVVKNSPLDNDRISMTMLNGGRMLRSLVNAIPVDNTQSKVTFTSAQTKMICNPISMTADRKVLDVAVNAISTGVNRFVLFKEISRTIKI